MNVNQRILTLSKLLHRFKTVVYNRALVYNRAFYLRQLLTKADINFYFMYIFMSICIVLSYCSYSLLWLGSSANNMTDPRAGTWSCSSFSTFLIITAGVKLTISIYVHMYPVVVCCFSLSSLLLLVYSYLSVCSSVSSSVLSSSSSCSLLFPSCGLIAQPAHIIMNKICVRSNNLGRPLL